jgi:hypothetical protein
MTITNLDRISVSCTSKRSVNKLQYFSIFFNDALLIATNINHGDRFSVVFDKRTESDIYVSLTLDKEGEYTLCKGTPGAINIRTDNAGLCLNDHLTEKVPYIIDGESLVFTIPKDFINTKKGFGLLSDQPEQKKGFSNLRTV